MNSKQHVGRQSIGTRTQTRAVWLTGHGADDIHSRSVNGANPSGNSYRQIPEGQVLGYHLADQISYPLAADAAQSAVSSANVISVADVLQFTLGDWVELPTSVAANATRFRQITAIDYDNSTITLGGAAFSLSAGDLIEVDPTRSIDTVQSNTSSSNDLDVADGSRFAVGDVLEIDTVTGRTITGISSNTITVDGAALSLTAGDQVVSNRDGDYDITTETVDINMYTYEAQNITAPCRSHGRVREARVIGLTATAKAELAPLVMFDDRLY